MAEKIKIELNSGGIGELLKSSEVDAFLQETASGVRQSCGAGYETDSYHAGSRVIASVFTANSKAAKDNLQNNTLLKAVSR